MYNVSVQYNGNITFLYFIIEFNENIHRHSRRFFLSFVNHGIVRYFTQSVNYKMYMYKTKSSQILLRR